MSTTPVQKPTLLSIRNIAKTFGRNVVLGDVSLEIAEGEFLTILGESGSGKTTLLRIIAGFETATSGELWMGPERIEIPATDLDGAEFVYDGERRSTSAKTAKVEVA